MVVVVVELVFRFRPIQCIIHTHCIASQSSVYIMIRRDGRTDGIDETITIAHTEKP